MHPWRQHLVTAASLALGLGPAAIPAARAAAKESAGHHGGTSSAAGVGDAFRVRDLVSDGAVPAAHTDKSLVNPWGIASGGTGPVRVADSGTALSTAFDGSGQRRSVAFKVPDGLWGLEFGNDAPGQPGRTLFFAAGPNDEADGLFGSLRALAGG